MVGIHEVQAFVAQSGNRRVCLFAYLARLSAHYHVLAVGLVPNRDELDSI